MCSGTLDERIITKLISQSGTTHKTVMKLVTQMVKMLPPPVQQHSLRVSEMSRRFAETACGNIGRDDLDVLESAGFLHDIGKLFVCESILNKPTSLTVAEYKQVQQHTSIGQKVLFAMGVTDTITDSLLYHHENHDGSGYPSGLAGIQIPLSAQIIHIIDVFDALTNHRPYRPAYASHSAMEIMLHQREDFNPDYLARFISQIKSDHLIC